MTADKTDTRNEAAIENEVRRTQDEIGDTVDRLEEKMNPRDVTRSVIGEDNSELAEEALQVARTNPIPVALIAIGLIWLIATTRTPTVKRVADRITGKRREKSSGEMDLRPRSAEPAPIGPPPETGQAFDRRPEKARF